MLREEEAVEESVYAEEGVSGKDEIIVLSGEISSLLELGEFIAEAFIDFFPELVPEVVEVHTTEFPLQDEFTEEAFLLIGEQGSPDGRPTLLKYLNVLVDVREVLVVDASEMTEGGHA